MHHVGGGARLTGLHWVCHSLAVTRKYFPSLEPISSLTLRPLSLPFLSTQKAPGETREYPPWKTGALAPHGPECPQPTSVKQPWLAHFSPKFRQHLQEGVWSCGLPEPEALSFKIPTHRLMDHPGATF